VNLSTFSVLNPLCLIITVKLYHWKINPSLKIHTPLHAENNNCIQRSREGVPIAYEDLDNIDRLKINVIINEMGNI